MLLSIVALLRCHVNLRWTHMVTVCIYTTRIHGFVPGVDLTRSKVNCQVANLTRGACSGRSPTRKLVSKKKPRRL